jgi:DNA-binding transcriptional ArsR family regulator
MNIRVEDAAARRSKVQIPRLASLARDDDGSLPSFGMTQWHSLVMRLSLNRTVDDQAARSIFSRMVDYASDPMSMVFRALGDPTRRAMLRRLAGGERTVGELAEPFDMSLPAVSKHLTVLERAGLVVRMKDGRIRHCRLIEEPMRDAFEWIGTYGSFWEGKLDSLGRFLNEPQRGRRD